MQTKQESESGLLSARQVQQILHIDRSTVYRMAEDGRLPAIRVGKQWRFPAQEIRSLIGRRAVSAEPPLGDTTAAIIDAAAELLGVSLVVTDMDGLPVTSIANPCAWLVEHEHDQEAVQMCVTEWRRLAEEHSFEPRFQVGETGFECARAFIRSGRELTGMVLVGGVCPPGDDRPDLFSLSDEQRDRVLEALPRIAATISRHAPRSGVLTKEAI